MINTSNLLLDITIFNTIETMATNRTIKEKKVSAIWPPSEKQVTLPL